MNYDRYSDQPTDDILKRVQEEHIEATAILKGADAIRKRIAELQIQKVEFPLHCLPPRIEAFVRAYMTTFHVPADHYGLSILTVAGAAIGNSAYINDRDTLHPAVLYSCLVDVPGSGKTPTLNTVLAPLLAVEQEKQRAHAQVLAEMKNAQDSDAEPPPRPEESVVVDFTLESLVDVLEHNYRGVVAFSDEIEGFLAGMDKYRNGKGGDGPFWLSAYTGQPYKANRRNRGARPVYIPRVFCPFIGGIQPGLLTSFADESRESSGFLARVLFTIPPVQKRRYYHKDRPDRSHKENWERVIRRLLEINPAQVERESDGKEFTVPHTVSMSAPAQSVYAGFINGLTDRINELDERDLVVRSTLVKFETHCLRFALILHFLDWATNNPLPASQQATDAWLAPGYFSPDDIANAEVSPDVMRRAVQISEYFMATGLEVVGRLDSYLKSLPQNYQIWYEELPEEFSTKIAKELADTANITERTMSRLLKKKELFTRPSRGRYVKVL